MKDDLGVAAQVPPGHSNEPASSLAANAGSVPNANADFRLKAWDVRAEGFGGTYMFYAPSRGAALAASWRAFPYDSWAFGDFLKIASCRKAAIPPGYFGKPITVAGSPAFYVYGDGQYIHFARPGASEYFSAHPLDVEPEEVRPAYYRRPAQAIETGTAETPQEVPGEA